MPPHISFAVYSVEEYSTVLLCFVGYINGFSLPRFIGKISVCLYGAATEHERQTKQQTEETVHGYGGEESAGGAHDFLDTG